MMKKYNIQYPMTSNIFSGPVDDYMILSEHHFLLSAWWTAYKFLSRQNKIKKVRICRSADKICLFEIRRYYVV
jgi:hypothetical protein